MAERCGVSVRTLQRHFHGKMGKSPKIWLAEQRQRKAMEFLTQGFSIKQTATELGYQYAAHFSRDFKKMFGYNPSEKKTQELHGHHKHLAQVDM